LSLSRWVSSRFFPGLTQGRTFRVLVYLWDAAADLPPFLPWSGFPQLPVSLCPVPLVHVLLWFLPAVSLPSNVLHVFPRCRSQRSLSGFETEVFSFLLRVAALAPELRVFPPLLELIVFLIKPPLNWRRVPSIVSPVVYKFSREIAPDFFHPGKKGGAPFLRTLALGFFPTWGIPFWAFLYRDI